MTTAPVTWLKSNWFAVVVPPLLLTEWLVVRSLGAEMGPLAETIVLFDLCVFMPALYVICYYRSVPLKALLLRVLGLVCAGIYLASYMVPASLQQILPELGAEQVAGLAVIMFIELRLLIATLRLVWGRDAGVAEVQAASGAPDWMVRLMVLEARFWKAVWRFLRRR
jgi:hypothetical protein